MLLVVLYFFCLPRSLFNDPTSTVIYDTKGNLLGARIADDGQWRFPESIQVSEKFSRAIVAFEDKRFYYHPGVDIIAIGRAILRNIQSGKIEEGGSTLSMQVIRLARKDKGRTLLEKFIEAILATRLELRYSKAEILALYASYAPFGGNVVGLDAAAWRYFGRNAGELSWAEVATLAVLPNSPALIHPGRNRDELLRKRNKLLNMLQERGDIREQDELLALQEPLPENPLPLPMLAPHLLDRALKTYKGKRIVTTLNSSIQQRTTGILSSHVAKYKSNRINNAAAIILDIERNEVLAYVGNVIEGNDNEHGSNVDVIMSPRSTGSILKPMLYALMLNEGEILPSMLIPDFPIYLSGFSPTNYNKTFDGAVPAKQALVRSLNVPAVRMLNQHGIEKFHRELQQLGMTTLQRSSGHYGLSLILGGAEGTLWDITSIYAYMARTLNHYKENDGFYNPSDMLKPKWSGLGEKKSSVKMQDNGLINAAAIWQTMQTLSEVNRPEEESSWRSFSSGRRVAWKTGTSYGHRDAWAVGVTPEYAVGVWVGNASGEGRTLLTGVNYAAPILFELFGLLPRSNRWFSLPEDEMIRVPVCRQSGHRASELCPQTDSVWIVERGKITPTCPYHLLIHLDKTQRFRVNSSCYSVSQIVSKPFFVLPPAQEWYYKASHPNYEALPPFMHGCKNTEERSPMSIVYPTSEIIIVASKQIDGNMGVSVFQATHRDADAELFWHIDDEYVGTTKGQHRLAVTLSAGKHMLSIVDQNGNTKVTRFEVRDKEE